MHRCFAYVKMLHFCQQKRNDDPRSWYSSRGNTDVNRRPLHAPARINWNFAHVSTDFQPAQ
eukprot:5151038-Amphidinium_carterae.1